MKNNIIVIYLKYYIILIRELKLKKKKNEKRQIK